MIAQRLGAYAKKKGIKQSAIANAVGMSQSAVSQTFSGNRTMMAEEYVAICDFLGVPYSLFAHEEGEEDGVPNNE